MTGSVTLERRIAALLAGALLLAAAPAAGSVARPPGAQDRPPARANGQEQVAGDDERDVLRITRWRFTSVADGATDARGLDAAAADVPSQIDVLESVEGAREMYARQSFPEIELLVKKRAMSPDAALALGEGRRRLIRQALEVAAGSLDASLRIGALDSGNKSSGAASDIDQTVFLWSAETGDIASSEQIAGFIDIFNAEFERLHGFSAEHAGIESMNGADFFPDWRQAHDVASFEAEARRVVMEKRGSPEAYRSEGQLKSQAEGRGYRALQEFGAQLESLDQNIARLEAEMRAAAENTDGVARTAQLQAEVDRVRARRAELERLSPWTEIVRTADGTLEARTGEDPRGKVLSIEPEMAERFSFDGAYDNWFMYEHHPDNRPKYLLRSVAEGMGLRSRLVRGESEAVYDLSDDRRVVPFDYDVEYEAGNSDLTRQFVRDVYGQMEGRPGGMNLTRAQRALDAAARFRLRHKQRPKADGTPYSEADIWGPYLPAPDPNTPEATRYEIARARWEIDARELMIENLLLTSQDPATVLTGPFDAAEFRRIVERVRAQDPDARPDPEALRRSAELQLFHGFRDLMTADEVRALASWDGEEVTRPRLDGLVGRMLADSERTGGAELRGRLEALAREAAAERFLAEARAPGAELVQAAVDTLRLRMDSARATYDQVSRRYERGVYTRDYVARQLADGFSRQIAQGMAGTLEAVGFRGNLRLIQPDADGRIPAFEVEWGQPRFSGRTLLNNLASTGNLDSALQIYEIYLSQGTAAATSKAVQELLLQLPRASEVTAAYSLLAEGDLEPAIQAGTVMLVPGAAQAYALVSIATTSVKIGGKLILDPLYDDTLDAIYQGYLPAESAGLLTPGRREMARSQLTNLLAPVAIRVVPHTPTDDIGQPILDGRGEPTTVYAVAPFSDEEAWRLEFVDSLEDQETARRMGALGGGEEWEELSARAEDWLRHPELNFEAKRASLFYHYGERVDEFIRGLGIEGAEDLETLFAMRSSAAARTALLPFFTRVVSHWVFDREEFAPFDSGGYNQVVFDTLAGPDRVAERQQNYDRLGQRLMGDFVRSYELLRGSDPSVESGIRRDAERALAAAARFEGNALRVAMEEAHEAALQPALANAVHEEILDRRLRRGSGRIQVHPRVVDAANQDGSAPTPEPEQNGRESFNLSTSPDAGDAVDVLVSIAASPEEHPRPWTVEPPEYVFTPGDDDAGLQVRVTVRDANGAVIGETVTADVGRLAADARELLPADRTTMVCALPPEGVEEGDPDLHERCLDRPGPPHQLDRVAVFFTPARDMQLPVDQERAFLWQILGPNGNRVASGQHFEREDGTLATPLAAEGAPGAFARVLDLWTRSTDRPPEENPRGPGTYRIQTADGEFTSSGVFGQGERILTRTGDWIDEGNFDIADVTWHYQGFVAERAFDFPLPGYTGLIEGRGSVAEPVENGSGVEVALEASWRIASSGGPTPVSADRQGASSTLRLRFPETIRPGGGELPVIDVALEHHSAGNVFGRDHLWVAGLHRPTVTTETPPDRWLVDDTSTGIVFGSRSTSIYEDGARTEGTATRGNWVWLQGASPMPGEFQNIGGQAAVWLETAPREQRFGHPSRTLPEHLADPESLLVVPVFYSLTDHPAPATRELEVTSYGYALYRPVPGRYEGPGPRSTPGDPGTVADRPPGDGGGAGPDGGGGPDEGDGPDGGRPGGGATNTPGANPDGSGNVPTSPSEVNPSSPDAAALIRQWLSVAEPPVNVTHGADYHYNHRGTMVGTGPNGEIGRALHDEGLPFDPVFVWNERRAADSVDHCTLEEFVLEGLAGDVAPPWCVGRYDGPAVVMLLDVRGRTLREARELLAGDGLRLAPRLLGAAPDASRANRIARQSPDPSTEQPVTEPVEVWVWSDYVPVSVRVPSVAGLASDAARALAEGAGLEVVPVLAGPAPSPERAFTVAEQSPRAGESVDRGAVLELRVWSGYVEPDVPVVRMPDLRGLTLPQALAQAGVAGVQVTPTLAGPAPAPESAQRVESQSHPPGTEVEPGTTVTLRVWSAYQRPQTGAEPNPPGGDGGESESTGTGESAGPGGGEGTAAGGGSTDSDGDGGPDGSDGRPFALVVRPYLPDLEAVMANVGPDATPEDLARIFASIDPETARWQVLESPIVIAIEAAAAPRYARPAFRPGSRWALEVFAEGTDPDTGTPFQFAGAMLLEVVSTYDGLQQVAASHPSLAEDIADGDTPRIDRADGTGSRRVDSGPAVVFGPLTEGWSVQARRRSVDFMTQMLGAMNDLSLECFVATAIYGDPFDPKVEQLRSFRDGFLRRSVAGRRLIDLYYTRGPGLARTVMRKGWGPMLRPSFDLLAELLDDPHGWSPWKRTLMQVLVERAHRWLSPKPHPEVPDVP